MAYRTVNATLGQILQDNSGSIEGLYCSTVAYGTGGTAAKDVSLSFNPATVLTYSTLKQAVAQILAAIGGSSDLTP